MLASFDRSRPPPGRRTGALVAVLALLFAAAPARADDDDDGDPFDLDWSYLYDGGAVPFVYGSGALAATAMFAVSPPATPRLFAVTEGGEPRQDESIPDAAVAGFTVLTGFAVGGFDRDARWFHTKGFVQSALTTAAATEVAKRVFGRHRPRFDPMLSDSDRDRESFFSGHSSMTWSSITYLGLYLRRHGFAPWRGARALAWWEVPAYASLGALGVYVSYTRVDEHYHYLSDVVVGATVGAATAAGFFWFQERRYRRAAAGARGRDAPSIALVPFGDGRGLQLIGAF